MVIDCAAVWKEVSAYVDGELDTSLRDAIDRHTAGCPRCRSVILGTQNIVALYSDERLVTAPVDLGRRIRTRIEGSGNLPFVVPYTPGRVWAFSAAAAAILVLAISFAQIAPHATVAKAQMAAQTVNVPPDLPVVAVGDGKLFHLAQCTYIHAHGGPVIEMTAGEALHRGYTPCLRCLGQFVQRVAIFLRSKTRSLFRA